MTYSITPEALGVTSLPTTDVYSVAAQLVLLAADEPDQGSIADALLVAATAHNDHAGEKGAQFALDVAEALARLAATVLQGDDG